MIAKMRLETHHRGTKTLLRVRTPPLRMKAVMAIVEDEQGTAVLLQLYHQPDEEVVPASEIVQTARVCIVKEAFIESAAEGTCSLRVDHVSDIIWLDDTDERVPPQWRKPALIRNGASEVIRIMGNAAVTKRSWAKAQRLYSSAIEVAETPEQAQLAYLNRSLANLRLGRLRNALSDATQGGDVTFPSDKQLSREGRALYDLGGFRASLQKMETLAILYRHNAAVKPELKRIRARLREQQTGEYDFTHMGRGLSTTAPVSAGQLLVCEKAFAYAFDAEDAPAGPLRVLTKSSTNRTPMGARAHLPTQIVQKLYHDPQLRPLFLGLYSGDHASAPISESSGPPVVDSFQVERIMGLNCFGAFRNSFWGCESKPFRGVWLLASRINHSCVGNCNRAFLGDVMIIRATRSLDAGAELLFHYVAPRPMDSYNEAQMRLSKWGFTYSCDLCARRKATPAAVLDHRKRLYGQLMDALGDTAYSEAKALKLLCKLEKTHKPVDAIRMELSWLYIKLGDSMLVNGRPNEAINTTVRGLEALGFTIVASPPRLEVVRWGMMTGYTVCAFVNIYEAYQAVDPELCLDAKRVAETAYSMVMGERDSLSDAHPRLIWWD